MATQDMLAAAQSAVKAALGKGAQEASARTYRVRDVNVKWRDGRLEQIDEATTRGLGLTLYVDGRYSNVSTSDLRPEALDTFIGDSVVLTRALAKDPFRTLPDPKLYEGQAKADLLLEDPKYSTVTPEQRRSVVKEIEAAARSVKGAAAILSVTTNFSDTLSETWRVTSNGFSGARRDTSFFISAEASVKDPDGRKPEDYAYGGARFVAEVPKAADRRPRGRRARPLPPRGEEGRVGRDDDGRREPRRGPPARLPPRPPLGRRAPAEALVPRRQARPGDREPRPHARRRPARPEGLRLAPLRRRGNRREADAGHRSRRPQGLLHRHLLREEAPDGPDHRPARRTSSGRSGTRTRRPFSPR